jgi:phosphoribosylformylglycinamidine cyclo-ligase
MATRKRRSLTYQQAGVDIAANDRLVELIRPIVRTTADPRMLGGVGGFAGLFRLNRPGAGGEESYKDPVLVGCTDGVGTKVLLARESGRWETVGIDLVAMSVNDMLTVGARPLFFLDYLAVHKLDPPQAAALIDGVAAGCRQAGCALLGGETAEMPDLYGRGDFDLAGFAVGVVERRRIIDGSRIQAGDAIVGLPASGIHSNGLSLARRVVFKEAGLSFHSAVPGLDRPIGEELLTPTRIYVEPVLGLLERYRRRQAVRAMAHITGGGLPGNVVRVLPEGLRAVIHTSRWAVPPVFSYLQSFGVERGEMFRVFNMGIGFVLIVRADSTRRVLEHFRACDLEAVVIGEVERGKRAVKLVR